MPQPIDDPRPILLRNLNLSHTRVEFSADHIVLLCGGKVVHKERPDDPEPIIRSLRHAISHSNPRYETFRPEDILDWHSDGLFKNLLNFEENLAGICSLVVIIIESAGSIAELSAFSQLPELSKKILAIKSRDFDEEKYSNSFINLGVLRFMKEKYDAAVRNYPWSIDRPDTISVEVIADITSDIHDELNNLPKSTLFKSSLNSHVIVLICEIVNLFAALKETEISEYLQLLDITLHRDELKRKLFLLEKFHLIKKETYSDATFYLTGRAEFHKLRLSIEGSAHHDPVRTQIECLAFYKHDQKQRNRFRAIQQAAIGLQK